MPEDKEIYKQAQAAMRWIMDTWRPYKAKPPAPESPHPKGWAVKNKGEED